MELAKNQQKVLIDLNRYETDLKRFNIEKADSISSTSRTNKSDSINLIIPIENRNSEVYKDSSEEYLMSNDSIQNPKFKFDLELRVLTKRARSYFCLFLKLVFFLHKSNSSKFV